jgi:hypothetical protein
VTPERPNMSTHLNMSNRLAIKQIQAVPCPTCGAKPGEKCELHSGLIISEQDFQSHGSIFHLGEQI